MIKCSKASKYRVVFVFLFLIYLLFCQSCARMRMNVHDTKAFFKTTNSHFLDSTVFVDGSKIHYIQTGNLNQATLFFVHGSPGSWDAFKMYLQDSLLQQHFRMIAIDRPGFGYSNFGNSKNLFEQAHDIEAMIMSVQNGKNSYLIGHSYGGPIVVKMAVDKPNYFSGIVVLAGAVDPEAENPEKWRLFFKAKPFRYIVPGALRPANDELWWLKEDLKILKPTLNKIKTNVTIIHGTKDNLVPYSNVGFMQQQFVNAKSIDVVSIKDADHFIPWSHFELIRNKLLTLQD